MNSVVTLLTKRRAVDMREFVAPKGLLLHRGNWFVRLLWWLIGKFEHQFSHLTQHERIKTVSIDTSKVLEAIHLSSRDIRRIYDRDVEFLLIGRDLMHKLYGEAASHDFYEFPIQGRFGIDGQTTVLGLTAVVIPWMEGFCLVPKLNSRRMVNS